MFRKVLKIAACTVTTAVMMIGVSITAQATSAVLPSGGASVPFIQKPILDEPAALSDEDKEQESFVISQMDPYTEVRSMPDVSAQVLGKMYDNAVGTLIKEENGWYLISSGSLTGYVKAEYCVTGEEAIELANRVFPKIATVTTRTLRVREEPSLQAEILTLVPINDQLVVSEEIDGWVKVDTEEVLGWISTDYCVISQDFKEAESIEEERERRAKEEEASRKAREAVSKSAKSSDSGTSSNIQAPTITTGTSSELGQAVVEYALQFVGNPYVYGGTSLTKGADCSGFVMSVYAAFGVNLPHSSASDRKQGYAVDGLANAQPGDLICYSGHVAIYVGDNQIVHASNSKKGIIVSKADYTTILAVRRIF